MDVIESPRGGGVTIFLGLGLYLFVRVAVLSLVSLLLLERTETVGESV